MSQADKQTIKVMWMLGYAGLIPFYFMLMLDISGTSFMDVNPEKAMAQYAAVIVSFLGAIHWGTVVSSNVREGDFNTTGAQARLLWSVIPSIVAWFLLLFYSPWALFAFAVLIFVLYAVDFFWLNESLNTHYLKLRLHLTVLVFIALILAIWV